MQMTKLNGVGGHSSVNSDLKSLCTTVLWMLYMGSENYAPVCKKKDIVKSNFN